MPLTEHQTKNAKPREQAYKLADVRGAVPARAAKWRQTLAYEISLWRKGKAALVRGLSWGWDFCCSEKRTVAKAMLAEGRDPMKNKSETDPGKSDAFRVIGTSRAMATALLSSVG